MTTDELDRALRQLRLSGMAETLTVRTQQARAESLGPHDFLGLLVHDELQRRRDRLIERRIKEAGFRDHKSLDPFNWSFNPGIDRALIFELATGRFIEQHDDCLILGNAGVGKSHIAQAIGVSAIHAGFRVLYREAHRLFEELVFAAAIGERTEMIASVPRQTDCTLRSVSRPRFTFSRMSDAEAVQMKGFGSRLWTSMYCSIAAINSSTL